MAGMHKVYNHVFLHPRPKALWERELLHSNSFGPGAQGAHALRARCVSGLSHSQSTDTLMGGLNQPPESWCGGVGGLGAKCRAIALEIKRIGY